ncbi:sugar phosphate nucleotidyltransferase [Treponema sp. HNW]|uniref:mannose-1-phosphate guanylyltransferase n=1 Tax=Treponema sp. HNW TaxID=3116654 RepID=UPI003D0D2E10
MMHIVILAGGFGERLWPASSPEFPKQFMALKEGLSFFQQALERAVLLTCLTSQEADTDGGEHKQADESVIAVITRKQIVTQTVKQCNDFAQGLSSDVRRLFFEKLLVIAEPSSRHTAPPLALMSRYIQALCRNKGIKEEPILSLTGDHIIEPFDAFSANVQTALEQALQGRFVCFAIPPTEASTGFGYIKAGVCAEKDVYKIDSFKEKPDAQTAQAYLKSGSYYWNSGMFCFLPSIFMNELKLHAPDIASHFPECDFSKDGTYSQNVCMTEAPSVNKIGSIKAIENWIYMENAYQSVPSLAVDVAVAERTDKAYAVRASFEWRDVGTWENFADLFSENANTAETETSGCFVYSDIPAVLCGVRDIIVVVKNGKLFITKKGSSTLLKDPSVRDFIAHLDLK